MCCSDHVLSEIVLVENIKELGGGRTQANVQVDVQIAGNYQRRSVRWRVFEKVRELIEEQIRNGRRTGSIKTITSEDRHSWASI